MTETMTRGANAPASDSGEMWQLKLRATGKRPKTVATYMEGLRSLERFTGKDGDAVTRLEVMRWLEWMQTTMAPASASVRLRSAKRFFAMCVEEGLRTDDPTTGLTVKVQAKAFKVPTTDEIAAMLRHCRRDRSGTRDAAIIALLAGTGARRGEIAALRSEDIDLSKPQVTLHNSKSVRRTVPITSETAIYVKRWMLMHKADGPLWGVNHPEDLVRRAPGRHCNGAWSAHSLRRAYAANWLVKGMSQTGLMSIAGWTDPTMVWHYAKGAAEMIAHEEFRKEFGN